jgi:hypothetical protein
MKEAINRVIPDKIFEKIAGNPNGFTDVSEIFREAEEILGKHLDGSISGKSEAAVGEFKEAGNECCKSGKLKEALINYNEW